MIAARRRVCWWSLPPACSGARYSIIRRRGSASKIGSSMDSLTDELIRIEERLGAHNYHPLDVVLTRGQGVWVWDVDGNRYLDCLSAYSAVNQGHCHPKIYAAMVEQAR